MTRAWTTVMTIALASTLLATGCQAEAPVKTRVELQTEDQKTLYALGLMLGKNLSNFSLTPEELEIVKRGMDAAVTGAKPEVEMQAYQPKVGPLGQARASKLAAVEAEKGKTFLEQVAKEPGAVKAESGLVYVELGKGTGESPKPTDTVKVNYKGTLVDGTEFDSSYKRGQPAEFPLNRVIPCWTEGVQKMTVGGKAKLVCPAAIAYGDRGHPPKIPGGATLIFELELLAINKPAAAPAPPAIK